MPKILQKLVIILQVKPSTGSITHPSIRKATQPVMTSNTQKPSLAKQVFEASLSVGRPYTAMDINRPADC